MGLRFRLSDAHDLFVLLAPFALEFFQFSFPRQVLEPGLEMSSHAARLPYPVPDGAHHSWKILGADKNKRENAYEQ
jgi:hypothetical protein